MLMLASLPVVLATLAVPMLPSAPELMLSTETDAPVSSTPLTTASSTEDKRRADQNEIVVSATPLPVTADPLATVNVSTFAITQDIDRAITRPLAMGYAAAVPSPLRDGVHNVLENLHQPTVALNYLLQFKPGKAVETLVRFAINSTIGVAGLFDFAKRKPFNLPDRPNGLADTLGYYGVGPGPYMYLPLIGSTTLRDLIGLGVDRLLLPVAVGKPFNSLAYNVPTGALKILDHRVRFDAQYHQLNDAGDGYATSRDFYMHQRAAEIEALHHRRQPPQPGIAKP